MNKNKRLVATLAAIFMRKLAQNLRKSILHSGYHHVKQGAIYVYISRLIKNRRVRQGKG